MLNFFPAIFSWSWLANQEGIDVRKRNWALHKLLFSPLARRNSDTCIVDKPGPGTRPAGQIAAAVQPRSTLRCRLETKRAFRRSAPQTGSPEESRWRSRLPFLLNAAVGLLKKSDFKWVAATRPRLQENHVAAWHTLIHKVACMCEKPHRVLYILEPGKKKRAQNVVLIYIYFYLHKR